MVLRSQHFLIVLFFMILLVGSMAIEKQRDARRNPTGRRQEGGFRGKQLGVDKPRRESVLDAGKCLIFYHIPKTGGSTLIEEISQWVPNSRTDVFRWYSSQGGLVEKVATWQRKQSQPILWTGHFDIQMGELVTRKTKLYSNNTRCFQFTSLRDPVEKVISGYYYMRVSAEAQGDWQHCLHGPWLPTKEGAGAKCIQFDNDDTRRFSGDSDIDCYDTISVMKKVPFHGVTPHHLQKAMRHLEALDAVLITEYMEESFLLLGCKLNIPASALPPKPPVRNVGRRREPVSDDVLDLIVRHNQLDLSLYRHAKLLFARQLRDCNIPVPSDLLSSDSSSF